MLFLAIYLSISALIIFKDRDIIMEAIHKRKDEIHDFGLFYKILFVVGIMFVLIIIAIPLDVAVLIKAIKEMRR